MERRAHPRVEVSKSVLYVSDIYPRPKVASTVDLSLGGTRIKTLYSLNSGEGIEISIAIHPEVIKCRGKVVYAQQVADNRLEAGVRFEEMSRQDRLYLGGYISHVMDRLA